MRLMALSNLDRGSRDLEDARRLAAEVGIVSEEELTWLYVSIHDEEPSALVRTRLAQVLQR